MTGQQVTDPALLEQLNAPAASAGPGQPVSDPALLAQLNAASTEPEATGLDIAAEFGRASNRGFAAVPEMLAQDKSPMSVLLPMALSAPGMAAEAISPGFSEGMFGIPGKIFQGAEYVGTAVDRLRDMASEATQSVRDTLFKRQLPPQGPIIEGLLTGIEFATSSLVPGGSAKAIGSTALAFGAGAGTGKALAQAGDFGEGATLVTELLLGLGAATKGRVVTTPYKKGGAIWKKAKEVMADIHVPGMANSEKILHDAAMAIYRSAKGDPEAVLGRLKAAIKQGDAGTVAQIADDAGMRSMQRAIESGDRTGQMRSASTEGRAAIREQGAERLGGVALEGVAADAALPSAERVGAATERAGVLNRAQAAQSAARLEAGTAEQARIAETAQRASDEAVKAVAVRTPDVSTAGIAERGLVKDAETAAKGIEKTAWDAVPQKQRISTGTVQAKYNQILDDVLSKAERKDFMASATGKEVQGLMDDLVASGAETGLELQSVAKLVSDKVSAAVKRGDAASRADAVSMAVRNMVVDIIDKSRGGSKFMAARAASMDRMKTFGQESPLGRALQATNPRTGKTAGGFGAKAAPSGAGGEETAAAVKQAGKFLPEGALAETTAAGLRARFMEKANPEGKGFNPTAAQNWVNQHSSVLKEHPKVADELNTLIVEGQEAALAGKQTKAATKALERTATTEGGVLTRALASRKAKIAGTQPAKMVGKIPSARVGSIFKNDRPTAPQLRELVNTAKRSSNPKKAVADLQAATRDAIRDAMTDNTGKNMSVTAAKFMQDNKAALEEVFKPDVVARLTEWINTTQRAFSRQGKELRTLPNVEVPGVIRAFFRVAGAKVGGITTKQPLLVSNMSTALVKKHLQDVPQGRLMDAMINYSSNPKELIKKLDEIGAVRRTPQETIKMIDDIFLPETKGPLAGALAQANQE